MMRHLGKNMTVLLDTPMPNFRNMRNKKINNFSGVISPRWLYIYIYIYTPFPYDAPLGRKKLGRTDVFRARAENRHCDLKNNYCSFNVSTFWACHFSDTENTFLHLGSKCCPHRYEISN
jgi:hypothetical protein